MCEKVVTRHVSYFKIEQSRGSAKSFATEVSSVVSDGVVPLYFGGFSSDTSSLIGPYTLGFGYTWVWKKHATETPALVALFANTLCFKLMNLSFVISCSQPN